MEGKNTEAELAMKLPIALAKLGLGLDEDRVMYVEGEFSSRYARAVIALTVCFCINYMKTTSMYVHRKMLWLCVKPTIKVDNTLTISLTCRCRDFMQLLKSFCGVHLFK